MVAERNLMEDERAVITSTDSVQYREKSKNWDTQNNYYNCPKIEQVESKMQVCVQILQMQ